ncbi:hypothetical protein SK128_003244 [Halocaridina rubra]|uniref:Protein with SprT-like domain at the N terminus n=1 Tax=Halocaridina rubra TaxID=373956 RepID=A0AAN8WTC3_HALRR
MENFDIDLSLAIQLQAQFEEELRVNLLRQEEEENQILLVHNGTPGASKKSGWNRKGELDEPSQEKLSVSLVDPSWELIDPNPNIHTLFLTFNNQFFWGRLDGIEVRWSPRMTLCAGVCCYEGRGGLCSVRLSLPLLKLRPRKDLIETLLHEMIHAYLFVTANNRDRDGHGPEFHKHMYRINNVAGTKISVYHTFHDEVDAYRQHIWQCNGPCRQRRPYFGLVKRSMNRAPGPRDPWWQQHQQSCGGTYTKIREPEGYGEKKKKNGNARDQKGNTNTGDIRKFLGKGLSLNGGSNSSRGIKSNAATRSDSSSLPLKENIPGHKRTKNSDALWNLSDAGKTKNVHGFGSTATGSVKPVNVNNATRSNVHGFSGSSPANKKPRKMPTDSETKPARGNWKGDANGGAGLAMRSGTGSKTVTIKGKITRQADTKTEIPSSSSSSTLPSVTPFQGQGYSLGGGCSNGVSKLLSLPSSSALSRSTKKTSESKPGRFLEESNKNEYAKCPVCNLKLPVEEMNSHLDECIGDFDDDDGEEWTTGPSLQSPPLSGMFSSKASVLSDDENDISVREVSNDSFHNTVGAHSSAAREMYPCPVCNEHVSGAEINDHLDTHF